MHANICISVHDHGFAAGIHNDIRIFDFNCAVEGGFVRGLFGNLSCATDMECPHRELRAWFADRLRGNNADCFTHVDVGPTGQIPAIAFAANTTLGLACQDRPYHYAKDALLIDEFTVEFLDHLSGFDDNVPV